MADINDRTQNVSLHDEVSDSAVTTTVDGSKLRLDVNASATITNNESPTKYQLKTDYDATGDTITSASDSV